MSLDKNMLCPFHEDRSPSMMFNKSKADLHCFSCHKDGETRDIFDLIAVLLGIMSFSEQRQKAIELLVENGDGVSKVMCVNSHSGKTGTAKMERPTSAEKSFSATITGRIYKPFEGDEDCLQYLEQRSITCASAKKFKLKCWEYEGNKYLVIPCDDRFYTRRKFITGLNDYPKFWKPRESTVSLFNGKALEQEHSVVFVLESAIDAITMDQLGFPAIALNGKEHYGRLIEKAEAIRNQDVSLIILMDNDPSGEGVKTGGKTAVALQKMGVYCYLHRYQKTGMSITDFLTECKDINEAYVTDPLKTMKAVTQLFNLARELSLIKPADTSVVDMKSLPNPLEQFGRADNK